MSIDQANAAIKGIAGGPVVRETFKYYPDADEYVDGYIIHRWSYDRHAYVTSIFIHPDKLAEAINEFIIQFKD